MKQTKKRKKGKEERKKKENKTQKEKQEKIKKALDKELTEAGVELDKLKLSHQSKEETWEAKATKQE